jgi:hypothetical protein
MAAIKDANPLQTVQKTSPGRVAVFWDYGKCPCPIGAELFGLTLDIKSRIDRLLSSPVKSYCVKMYYPLNEDEAEDDKQARIHKKANDLDIQITDVALNGNQLTLEKRIITDIGLFAAELAETGGNEIGHIVLVTDDSDYGCILAPLREKPYIKNIILFVNDVTRTHPHPHDFKFELFIQPPTTRRRRVLQILSAQLNVVLWNIRRREVDVNTEDLEYEYKRGLDRLSAAQQEGVALHFTPEIEDEEFPSDLFDLHVIWREDFESYYYKFEI